MYIVLDLETANADQSSICQIGAVFVRDGAVVDRIDLLIDPDDYFDPFNIGIHGITPDMVVGHPRFPDAFARIAPLLANQTVITHGPFDRIAIARASERHKVKPCEVMWLDNQKVVRRTWPQFSKSGYALGKLVKYFNIPLKHHNALEDATATAAIFAMAMAESGLTIEQWFKQTTLPISPTAGKPIERTGDPEAPFAGEVIVFTGALMMPRQQAADHAARLGFDVADNVTKKTTTLCVGIQDSDKLAGYEKSSKHRKVEGLIADGYEIAIIGERDFMNLVR